MTGVGAISYFFFQLVVPLLFTAALAAFLWGGFLYVIAGAQDEEMQESGKVVMLYGLVTFVVMTLLYLLLIYIFSLGGG